MSSRMKGVWHFLALGVLLLTACAPHRGAGDARLSLARGEAARDSRQWGLAAGYFTAARQEHDSPEARWGQAWATGRASQLRWARKFEGSVPALAFSPEGRELASAGHDARVRVWNVSDGTLRLELTGHPADVLALAFSPDGRRLASAGAPGEIRLWDTRQGQPVAVLTGHADVVRGLTFSPDGRSLASCGLDKTVRVWDVETGTERLRFEHDAPALSVAFSADGRRLLSTSMDPGARVWDLDTGREALRLVGHTAKVESGAFSADGRRILTAAADDSMRFWDAGSGQLIDVVRTEGGVSAAVIDPTFQFLVQSGWDGRVQLFDSHRGVLLERLEAHRAYAMTVALSPDGQTFASGGLDGALFVWSRPTPPAERTLPGHGVWVEALAFTQERELVSGAEDGALRWHGWDARAPEPQPLGEATVSLAVSPDRTLLAQGTLTGTVRVLDARSGRPLLELSGMSGSVRALAFAPDGRTLAAGGQADIQRWALPSGTPLAPLQGHTGKSWALAFDATGHRLASGGEDRTVRLWDVERRQQLLQRDTAGTVRAVAFSAPHGLLVTAGLKQPLQLWDARDGRLLQALDVGPGGALSLAVSPDGNLLASGGMDLRVRVWSLPSGERLGEVRGHQGVPTAVAFSPDGALLASAGADRVIRLLDVGGLAHPPPADTGPSELLPRYGLTWEDGRLRIRAP